MTKTYLRLRWAIDQYMEGNRHYSIREIRKMISEEYENGSITESEYNHLCDAVMDLD